MKTGYLIDMDGVIYRENNLIPGAADFVQALLDDRHAVSYFSPTTPRPRRRIWRCGWNISASRAFGHGIFTPRR
jgi:ribonucleotide monophosphatase NagD (HAD superfamily)